MPHPPSALAGVVLAAGSGTRLRPLTDVRPKALCPVGNVAMLDLALDRVRPRVEAVAVNAWHLGDRIVAHLDGRDVHLSVEEPEALETAGALGQLREWIDGRDVLSVNADVHHPDDLEGFVAGWDRERVRLLVVDDPDLRDDFDGYHYCGAALLPWRVVRELPAERLGLYEAVLGREHAEGRLDLVVSDAPYRDCGTPERYLAANLEVSDGASVVEPGAAVDGEVVGSVVWAEAHVATNERLVYAIRATDDVTVQVGYDPR